MSANSKTDDSLGEAVYGKVRELLRNGTLAPADRVSEQSLCKLFNVSRTPAREALQRLLSEGFLAHTSGGRMIVATIDIARAEEIYDMREAVECLAARLAAKRANTSNLIELRSILADQEKGQSNETEFLGVNDRFHRCIYRISNNRYVQHTAEILLASAEMIRGQTEGRYDYEAWSLKDHLAIYAAIENGDVAAAEEAARQHIRRGRFQRLALLLEGSDKAGSEKSDD
ncbi:GntR family transcriptional regulator [Martelella mediterranea]|uniref:GntR family transcriptional regulator n=1 Tax=Martelella mediterranea TaxID=293089 RepID=UPI001E602F8C|nr:GntR family transcriptional regulator [Martelella mediterranea]MCD1634746.1 GntR family transcriptional regulator [Martelella mediterranea]